MNEEITIFTDGSSIGNPGPGGWGAIISFPQGTVVELGGKELHTTNNRMELVGAIEALNHILDSGGKVTVISDSSYLINGASKWIHGWQKNGWITSTKEPVLNKELWEELYRLTKHLDVSWRYVPGHRGIDGNERVDEIAQGFSRGLKVDLFHGSAKEYGVDLNIEGAPQESARGKPYAYLSLVDGVLMRHSTWEECKKRVTGVAGAKYKKVTSEADEKRVLIEWGIQDEG